MISFLLAVSQIEVIAVIILAVANVAIWTAFAVMTRKKQIAAQRAAMRASTTTIVREKRTTKNRHIFIHHVYGDEDETVEEVTPEALNELDDDDDDDDDDDEKSSVIMIDGKPVRVVFRKSFRARLIQSTQNTKEWYASLVNHVLAYGMKGRVSWNYAAFHVGKAQVIRFNVRGRTLCVFFALDYSEYKDTNYKVEYNGAKRYSKTPVMMRIYTEKELRQAAELVDRIAQMHHLKRGTSVVVETAAKYPNDTRENLIARGLIKYNILDEDYSGVELATRKEKATARAAVLVRNRITAEEARKVLDDDTAQSLITIEASIDDDNDKVSRSARRIVVYVDMLSTNFNANDEVTIEELKLRRLIPASEKAIKIAARGALDKPLVVHADEFTLDAVKMIVLTGGKAVKKFY